MASKKNNNEVKEALKVAERKLKIFAEEFAKPVCERTYMKSCLKNNASRKRKLSVNFSENTVGNSIKIGHDIANNQVKSHNSFNAGCKKKKKKVHRSMKGDIDVMSQNTLNTLVIKKKKILNKKKKSNSSEGEDYISTVKKRKLNKNKESIQCTEIVQNCVSRVNDEQTNKYSTENKANNTTVSIKDDKDSHEKLYMKKKNKHKKKEQNKKKIRKVASYKDENYVESVNGQISNFTEVIKVGKLENKSVIASSGSDQSQGKKDLDESDWLDMEEDVRNSGVATPAVDDKFHKELEDFMFQFDFDSAKKAMDKDMAGISDEEFSDEDMAEGSDDDKDNPDCIGDEKVAADKVNEDFAKLADPLLNCQKIIKVDMKESPKKVSKATSAISKIDERLEAAKFRQINEQLYTTKSSEAVQLFAEEPALFSDYHQGFRTQVSKWPMNPLDSCVAWLNKKSPSWVVGDFGCGEGELAQRVKQARVHSFDLVALKPHVTACDMAHTPLADGSLDCAVFCLSLMGTNVSDFIAEAARTLKLGCLLKIYEVSSRIDDFVKFGELVNNFGFVQCSSPANHDYFVNYTFKKVKNMSENSRDLKKTRPIVLKPCLYKRR